MLKGLKLVVAFLFVVCTFTFIAKADTGTGTTFSVTKAVAPATAAPSSTLTYSITIKNISQANAAPQVVTDTLPTGFTFAGNSLLTTIAGNQVTFTPQSSGQVLTWTFDGDTLQSIPADQDIVISYQVTASSTTGEFSNQVCLTQPENVCTQSTVTITTNPNTGILDNIWIGLAIGVFLIFVASKMPHSRISFEEKVMRKK